MGGSLYHQWLVGGSIFFYFQPYLGKIPVLTNIFEMGWNHQLGEIVWRFCDYLEASKTRDQGPTGNQPPTTRFKADLDTQIRATYAMFVF